MGSATAKRSIRDAVARSDHPASNTANLTTMTVNNGTTIRIPHIQAPAPCPMGCTVTSAKLQLVQFDAQSGNRTLSLRRISEEWKEGTLTYANRPARTSTASSTAVVNGAGTQGRVVEFDVLADMQSFVDGEFKNWGWTLESSNDNAISFYTSEAVKNKPQLVVTWSNRPETPTDLLPAGGAVVSVAKPPLRWAFIDLGGDTTLAAVQVHLKGSATGWTPSAGFTSPVFDSGVFSSTKPQYDLAASAYGGMSSGGSVWWTVRHRDGAGLWSQWSDPQQVTYQGLPTVTLNSPGPVVNDTTFPWSWTVATQAKFQLLILDANGNELWNSKVITSSVSRAFTQPRGVVRRPGVGYVAVLRVWDSTNRQSLAGALAYTEVTQAFTYADTGTVAPVTGLVADTNDQSITLTWARATMPDQFTVWLGDDQHTVVAGTDVLTSGTSYEMVLYDVPPRIQHTLTVKAVVIDGSDVAKSSSANPTVDLYTDPVGVRLVDTATNLGVVFLSEPGQEIVESDMPEISERFEPVESEVAIQVTSVLRWFEGTVTGGILADYADLTAREQRARVLAMKATPMVPKVLVWGRNAVPVYLSKVNVTDVDPASGERYEVSFAFAAATPSPEYVLS
jgi:hypothetical protein